MIHPRAAWLSRKAADPAPVRERCKGFALGLRLTPAASPLFRSGRLGSAPAWVPSPVFGIETANQGGS
jgi:hypothetical protein